MNAREYLLTCLMEECMEVAQRASKAIRFGMDEIQPGQELTNAERLSGELNDLAGALRALKNFKVYEFEFDPQAILKKEAKILKFMEYSKQQGCLQE